MLTIEQLWTELRNAPGGPKQRRVDASHPLDLYADYDLPDRPGLVAVCGTRLARTYLMKAIGVEEGERADGRWSLRIVLKEPSLFPVFAALCSDIIASTRAAVDEGQLAMAVMGRIERWRHLLDREATGLEESVLRGLIGELLVLELELLATLPPRQAVAAWTGPNGTPQDFLLPSGARLEVKTVGRDATKVRINGLQQLDADPDPLVLLVVRAESTGGSAPGAVTAPLLVSRLRKRLEQEDEALIAFDAALASVGWHESPSHEGLALRPVAIDAHEVDVHFPRLTYASVPRGVEDADYSILLPTNARRIWRSDR